jgi:hypothetical protein
VPIRALDLRRYFSPTRPELLQRLEISHYSLFVQLSSVVLVTQAEELACDREQVTEQISLKRFMLAELCSNLAIQP